MSLLLLPISKIFWKMGGFCDMLMERLAKMERQAKHESEVFH